MRRWLLYKLLDWLHGRGYKYHDRYEPLAYWWLERGVLRRIWHNIKPTSTQRVGVFKVVTRHGKTFFRCRKAKGPPPPQHVNCRCVMQPELDEIS